LSSGNAGMMIDIPSTSMRRVMKMIVFCIYIVY